MFAISRVAFAIVSRSSYTEGLIEGCWNIFTNVLQTLQRSRWTPHPEGIFLDGESAMQKRYQFRR